MTTRGIWTINVILATFLLTHAWVLITEGSDGARLYGIMQYSLFHLGEIAFAPVILFFSVCHLIKAR